ILEGSPPANNQPVRVVAAPGSAWRYSGGGFEVSEQLLADLTGTPFVRFAAEAVLEPAGMASSTFEQPPPAALAARAASGDDLHGRPLDGRWRIYPEHAAAGLWTTPSDLARFVLALADAPGERGRRLLGAKAVGEMLREQWPGAGLGVQVFGPRFEKGGSNA